MRTKHLSSKSFVLSTLVLLGACGGIPELDGPKSSSAESSGGSTGKTHQTSLGGEGSIIPNAGSDSGGQSNCVDKNCSNGGTTSSITCGNKQLDLNEGCDDGNTVSGDGCDGICKVENGYNCNEVGKPCITNLRCGDGLPGPDESCDDGNTNNGDGCSSACNIEPGYTCVFGAVCTKTSSVPVCGNRQTENGESCDDGNVIDNDGCSSACKTESGYTCIGTTCTKDATCGNGVLNTGEQCDDGNLIPSDCCSATCQLEANCRCTTPPAGSPTLGQVCVSTVVCGDGEVMPGETCDDHNTATGDGCSDKCRIESGYTCPTPGALCTKAVVLCPNSTIDAGEGCDDGNAADSDGCSSSCKVEPGYTCTTAGELCSLKEFCGNGTVAYNLGERCDDGNKKDGDGCSTTCTVESSYSCDNSTGKSVCQLEYCGNGRLTLGEQCDDGNGTSNDGCSATCQVETGYRCPILGKACRAVCGDSLIKGSEQCDDKNVKDDDGCNSVCRIEPGYNCSSGTCVPSVCGNAIAPSYTPETGEGCDDGNQIAGDGCGPTCQKEPTITRVETPSGSGNWVPAVSVVCGDGLVMGGEGCDDGNTTSGDGCSSSCAIETGYSCKSVVDLPAYVDFKVTYRDFKSAKLAGGHPDFQYDYGNQNDGIVGALCTSANTATCGRLDSAGKPKLVDNTQSKTWIRNTDSFALWYRDGNAGSIKGWDNTTAIQTWTFTKTLRLTQDTTVPETYVFDSNGNNFYPLTKTEGSGSILTEGTAHLKSGTTYNIDDYVEVNKETCDGCQERNYGFTTEFRYFFQFNGGETLKFKGDDDVWVFVNGRLAVDLGGLHSVLEDSVVLGSDGDSTSTTDDKRFGLTKGGVYEIAFFHAERHTTASNFKLTLTGFLAPSSYCTPICGDGNVTATEECDLGKDAGGTSLNTGAYGGCTSACKLAPYCGDGVINGSESCDPYVSGTTSSLYGTTTNACTPDCKVTPYCGDGNIDLAFGETCDQKTANVASAYGPNKCTDKCTVAPSCGDGVIFAGKEVCDDGEANGTPSSSCSATCTLKCGDHIVDLSAGELCDEGADNGKVTYNGCTTKCQRTPYCGDGIKDPEFGEVCDDGLNDGSYGTCSSTCQLASYCGDGKLDASAGEECDLGSNNQTSPYGLAVDGSKKCTTTCRVAPYCGDHAVNTNNGESCDDGTSNSDTNPGSCRSNCSGYNSPPVTCGNGNVDSGEECDDGINNGQSSSLCDGRCQLKCGNGIKDTGEQCDNGINDGSYGTCSPTCALTAYCGDGTKNGLEECDLGLGNESAPYGKNDDGTFKCNKSCEVAPYCGDKRTYTTKEECDGQSGCLSTCIWDDTVIQ